MLNIKSFWPFGKKSYSIEDVIRDLYSGSSAKAGVSVNTDVALRVGTLFRCATVIIDSVATIPLRVMQKMGQERKKAEDHPLYNIFKVSPNKFQDALQFFETIILHLFFTGNAYVFVNKVDRGRRIKELIPISPEKVSVEQKDDTTLRYFVTVSEGGRSVRREYPQEVIWHLRRPSWNGFKGIDFVDQAKETIGLTVAAENTHASLHKNGMRPSGAYTVDGTLSDKQYAQLKAYLTREVSGIDNSGAPLILDRAAKFVAMTQKSVDAQHLETRKFQVEETCRWAGVLPIMVGYSDKTATYASAEQMFIAHNTFTARPWHRRIEKSIDRWLLTQAERDQGFYSKFFDAELLRGAAKDRAEFYQSAINTGWMSRNEVREFEDMNPAEGLDEFLIPLNMSDGTQEEGTQQEETQDDPDAI